MKYLEKLLYVYGPYKRKVDNRSAIWLYYRDGSKRFISYPKFLVEVALNRKLDPNEETIDHVDRDVLNNSWDNLRIVDRSTHTAEDQVRVELVPVACVWCGTVVHKHHSKRIKPHRGKGRLGPFCSRACSGKHSAASRTNRLPKHADQYRRWDHYADVQPTRFTITKLGETVADMAERLGLDLPTEEKILTALPRGKPGANLKKKKDGSPKRRRTPLPTRPCTICQQPTKNKQYCSPECCQKGRTKIKWPAEEKLRRLVWKYPTSYIAKKLGVSDAAVSKHCRKLGIEKPPRGYWAKQRAKDR